MCKLKQDWWELGTILISLFLLRCLQWGGLCWPDCLVQARLYQRLDVCSSDLLPQIASLPFIEFLISQQLAVPATWNTEVTQFVIWWSGKLTPAGRCFSIIKRSESVPMRTLEGISAREMANTTFYVSMLTGWRKKTRYRERINQWGRSRGQGWLSHLTWETKDSS